MAKKPQLASGPGESRSFPAKHRMSFLLALLLILIAVVIGWFAWQARKTPPGPPPKGPCTSAADCPKGTSCLNGRCVGGGCASGGDCPKGQTCKNHACVGGACTKNAQCPPGQRCAGGACVGGCQTPADCPSGDQCAGGVCVSAQCTTNAQCPKGQQCRAGSCVSGGCRTNGDCPKKQKCVGGACVGGGCKQNGDCPKGQICGPGGVCVGGCRGSADCPSGQKCLGGRCRPLNACDTSANCPKGDACRQGVCVAVPKCPKVPPLVPNTPYLIENRQLGPNYAIGAVPWTPNLSMFAPSAAKKIFQDFKIAPAATPGEYYLYSIVSGETLYVVRDPKTGALGFASTSAKYDPSKDPNAGWVYRGGVLSDPKQTYALAAATCAAEPQLPGCKVRKGGKTPPGYGSPYLVPFDPYACEHSQFLWDFAPA